MKRSYLLPVLLFIILFSGCTSTRQSELDAFSAKWKSTSQVERCYIVDIYLIFDHLKGKDRNKVIDFLGYPKYDENTDQGVLFIYAIGNHMNRTPEGWYKMYVAFDKNGLVEYVGGDD